MFVILAPVLVLKNPIFLTGDKDDIFTNDFDSKFMEAEEGQSEFLK